MNDLLLSINPQPIRAIDKAARRYGGYAVAFNVEQGDLYDTHFTPETDFVLEGKKTIPLLFQHGLDRKLRSAAVGVIDSFRTDDIGLWVEFIINEANQYAAAISQLIDAGVLALSSGSRAFETEIDDQKRVRYWPILEVSLTHTPADWTGKTKVLPIRAFTAEEEKMDFDQIKAAFRAVLKDTREEEAAAVRAAESERLARQAREQELMTAVAAAIKPMQEELTALRAINEALTVRLKKLEEMPAVDTLPQQSGAAAEVRSLEDYYNHLFKK